MFKLKSAFHDFKGRWSDPLDDYVDRLNCAVTVTLFSAFALILSTKLYFFSPVSCIFPAEHTGLKHWVAYYTSRCFVEGTYRMQHSNVSSSVYMTGGPTGIDIDNGKMSFYMWSPYVLFVFAFLFTLPKLFRELCFYFQPLDYEAVVVEVKKVDGFVVQEEYNNYLKNSVEDIMAMCNYNNTSKAFGIIASIGYVVQKWLYVLNIWIQFYILKELVGDGKMSWGWTMTTEGLFYNLQSKNFPALSYCRVDMKLNDLQEFDFPCVLPINLLNEKIYIFVWFWLLLLFAVTMCSAICASVICFIPSVRQHVIERLMMLPSDHSLDGRCMKFFVNEILFADGLLMLLFVKEYTGSIVVNNLSRELWKKTVESEDNFPMLRAIEHQKACYDYLMNKEGNISIDLTYPPPPSCIPSSVPSEASVQKEKVKERIVYAIPA